MLKWREIEWHYLGDDRSFKFISYDYHEIQVCRGHSEPDEPIWWYWEIFGGGVDTIRGREFTERKATFAALAALEELVEEGDVRQRYSKIDRTDCRRSQSPRR